MWINNFALRDLLFGLTLGAAFGTVLGTAYSEVIKITPYLPIILSSITGALASKPIKSLFNALSPPFKKKYDYLMNKWLKIDKEKNERVNKEIEQAKQRYLKAISDIDEFAKVNNWTKSEIKEKKAVEFVNYQIEKKDIIEDIKQLEKPLRKNKELNSSNEIDEAIT